MNDLAIMTSLLDEWAVMVQGMMDVPNQAHEAISQMHTSFGELHMFYSQAGDLDTANLITAAYNHALMIYNQGDIYVRAFAMGQVVIDELTGQREDALNELGGLLDAIRRGNEAHPALRWFATSIRAEERETLLDSDEVWMLADESLVDDIYKHLTGEYGLPFSAAKTLLNMIQGAQPMNAHQHQAFDAFWATLIPDLKGSK